MPTTGVPLATLATLLFAINQGPDGYWREEVVLRLPEGAGDPFALPNTLATVQVALTYTTSRLIVGARPARRWVELVNLHATEAVYLGALAGVTVATGYRLPPGVTIRWPYAGNLYGICASGAPCVGVADAFIL
jgi:hypothetical protein